MKHEEIQLNEMTLIGLTARTNNKNELNPQTGKIAKLASYYWENQIAEKIHHRKNPGVTVAAYTDFASDENGDYTYCIGEFVDSISKQDLSQFSSINIPSSRYQKFTTEVGKMPDVVISAWQKIWAMGSNDFIGPRKYATDFEVYDQRSSNPENSIVDIYIGV